MGFRVGIDVGGTFTDLVAFYEETGSMRKIKVPTSPMSPEVGVLSTLKEFLSSIDHGSEDIRLLIHATTLGTNVLIGQVGLELPKTGLLVTRGFRDFLEIGRQRRSELYNLFVERPESLIPRRLRLEASERIDARGKVLKSLEVQDVEEAAKKFERSQVKAVAIVFLHSYANPAHECGTTSSQRS